MFKFITEKPFWVNILVAIALFLTLFFMILKLLGSITNHGNYLIVPSVVGKKTNDAIRFLENKGFDVQIQDSVYTDTALMGSVLKQLPDPNSTVKINRTIFLTVNRAALPIIEMPSLEGKSLNFALEILKRNHLKLGDTSFKADFMKGSVLEQKYKGLKISPGSKLLWGSSIDLVVGSGLNSEAILVPSLIGMTFTEASTFLQENGINIGAIIADHDLIDTANAYVWKQSPDKYNEKYEPVYIQPGQIIDLWISAEKKEDSDTTISN